MDGYVLYIDNVKIGSGLTYDALEILVTNYLEECTGDHIVEFKIGKDTDIKKSCSTCCYAVTHCEGGSKNKLYECMNTEIDMRSHNTEKFYCAKWDKRYE